MSRYPILLFALLVPTDGPPDELLRTAVAAAKRGDAATAERLFARGEEHATDPGLIAFNRAALLFEQGDYREAERNYLRCLEDSAIPPDRRLRATFDRGVCLLQRTEDAKQLRLAVACFEQCRDATEGTLAADARHNHELAKLLWNQARAKQKEPPTPSDGFPEMPPEIRPPDAPPEAGGPETGTAAQPQGQATGQQPQLRPNATPTPTDKPTPGKGHAPVVSGDAAQIQKLSPEDTNAVLDAADGRLRTARRRNEQLRARPERPNVRDW